MAGSTSRCLRPSPPPPPVYCYSQIVAVPKEIATAAAAAAAEADWCAKQGAVCHTWGRTEARQYAQTAPWFVGGCVVGVGVCRAGWDHMCAPSVEGLSHYQAPQTSKMELGQGRWRQQQQQLSGVRSSGSSLPHQGQHKGGLLPLDGPWRCICYGLLRDTPVCISLLGSVGVCRG